MPLVSFQLWEISFYQQNQALVSADSSQPVLGVSIENQSSFPTFISSNKRTSQNPYDEFNLSIPSINLINVKVKVQSNNFDDSLAQLPGTALPGEKGNVFITGHSSVSQFYRADNFKAIFTNLPQVKKGDEVIAVASGQPYRYKVIGLKIIDPKEISVINPPEPQGRYLTLMTCVPPGLFLKRLIVLAELQ